MLTSFKFYLLAVVPEDGKDHLQQCNWIMKLSDINIQLELEPGTILPAVLQFQWQPAHI